MNSRAARPYESTGERERDSIWPGGWGTRPRGRGIQMVQLTPAQIEQFNADGFLILDRFLSAEEVALARTRFEPLFRGEFETGLYPDGWKWREGRGGVVGRPVRDAGGVAGRAYRPG